MTNNKRKLENPNKNNIVPRKCWGSFLTPTYALRAGSYSRSLYPHSDLIRDQNASIEKFKKFYYKLDGTKTKSTCKNTTKKEEHRLFERAIEMGAQTGPMCAISVSNVLFGSIYYQTIEPDTFFPGNLFNDAKEP